MFHRWTEALTGVWIGLVSGPSRLNQAVRQSLNPATHGEARIIKQVRTAEYVDEPLPVVIVAARGMDVAVVVRAFTLAAEQAARRGYR